MALPTSKTIIVSPSGKLYGSERTLLHFLTNTRKKYRVFVYVEDPPQFLNVLKQRDQHVIIGFKGCLSLYFTIAMRILLRKTSCIYVNEGGHIRYVRLLARCFHSTKFVVHIRLDEDASRERLNPVPSNVQLLCTSAYIASQVKTATGISAQVLSSPSRGAENDLEWNVSPAQEPILRVGIIGRLTDSKGIDHISSFCNFLEQNSIREIQMNFFGTVEETHKTKTWLRSIQNNRHAQIVLHYAAVDVVVHFNENEPLGVVFFESLNHRRPFIGFLNGGIGEIARELKLEHLMIDAQRENWESDFYQRLKTVFNSIGDFKSAREEMQHLYSIESYVDSLETAISI